MKCKYIVCYNSAVTGNRITSGCGNKQDADREAKALTKGGAKNVSVFPYQPARMG
jgi:hypothetical protein